MSTEDPRKVLQSIHEAMNKRDLEKAVSFFADDIIAITPNGTFKGKAENRQYFERALNLCSELKLTETGIYAEGNVVTHEYVVDETTKQGKARYPTVAVAEIKNGKVQRIREYYDRLTMAKQFARGIVATRVVNSIVNQFEKGLH